eukprot:jgi/Tetstr1/447479/TSEL_034860.t1
MAVPSQQQQAAVAVSGSASNGAGGAPAPRSAWSAAARGSRGGGRGGPAAPGRGGRGAGGKPSQYGPAPAAGGPARYRDAAGGRPVAGGARGGPAQLAPEPVTVADFGAAFGGEYERALAVPAAGSPQRSRYGLDQQHAEQQGGGGGGPAQPRAASDPPPLSNGNGNGGAFSSPATHRPAPGGSVEERLTSVKAELARLAAIEADLQRQVDEESEVIKLKAESASAALEIADLKEERASLLANAESERRSFVAQLQEKGAELERLKREAWGKDEAIRERDVQLMEQTKKQVDTDTNMAAAMDKISSAQALLSSREEEMEKVAAAKESEYKAREAELLSAITEWQRMVHSKEEAIWHMQAVHASEKSNMEAHFLHQINHILAEKRAQAEELAALKGGAPAGEVGNTSTPPPVAIATTAAPQMVPPQPGGSGAPPGQGGNSGGGLHWIESLMNGTAHKAAAAGSHPHANSAGGLAGWQQPQGKEEGQAHHPSLDPRVPRPNTGHAHHGGGPAAVRLLTDPELTGLLKKVVPLGKESARPWSGEDEMAFEALLAPFNWADHYGPQHGSVMDFLLSNSDEFQMLPDGSVFAFPKKLQPVFGTISPAGIPSPVGTPAAAAHASRVPAPAPAPAGRPSAGAVIVTPMPSMPPMPAASTEAPAAPAPDAGGAPPRRPNKVIQTVAAPTKGGGRGGEGKGRPESRGRPRRGGGGRSRDAAK